MGVFTIQVNVKEYPTIRVLIVSKTKTERILPVPDQTYLMSTLLVQCRLMC